MPDSLEMLKQFVEESNKRFLNEMPVEERLEGLSPDELLAALTPELRAALARASRKMARPPARRRKSRDTATASNKNTPSGSVSRYEDILQGAVHEANLPPACRLKVTGAGPRPSFPMPPPSAIVSPSPPRHPAPIHETAFMTLDSYAPCPCGSGKKFKWCCQPIYAKINRAFEQDAQGQHDAALRLMDEVTAEHSGNPEAWGQKAKLLYGHGKVELAEEALEKAFAVNRNYPYGLLLRAAFRFQEGEVPGALLLARRAADAYDPEAGDYLAEAYSLVYECEMKLNRPVAARAALKIVLHLQPAAEEIRQAFDQTFGEKSRLPAAARHEYTLMRPAAAAAGMNPAARRAAWDRALPGRSVAPPQRPGPRLRRPDPRGRGRRPRLVQPRPGPRLARRQRGRAGRAESLPGVGAGRGQGGADRDADGSAALRARHGRIVRLPRICVRLPVPRRADRRRPGQRVAARRPADDAPAAAGRHAVRDGAGVDDRRRHHGRPARGRLGSIGGLSDHRRAGVPHVGTEQGRGRPDAAEEVRSRLNLALGEAEEIRQPIQFHDVVTEALVFPTNLRNPNAPAKVAEHAQRILRGNVNAPPRRSLAGNTPIDAAAHGQPAQEAAQRGGVHPGLRHGQPDGRL